MYVAEILTVGNEILSGRTVNTNASHIARRLTSLGFAVRRMTVVMDDVREISQAFSEIFSRKPNLVVSTGGLGPTYDDRTAEGLANAVGLPLVYNEEALRQIKEKYDKLNLDLTEERKKMALMPKGSMPVENDKGIAPGIYLQYQGIEILATPGVPREMEAVLEVFISRYLKQRPNVAYVEDSVVVDGVMESTIAPHIAKLVKKYDLYIKTHPKGYELSNPTLEIQIAGSSDSAEKIVERVRKCKEEIIALVRELGGTIRTQ
ncbi:MAG: nicotinamide mononucleotide deamidase-related protein [Candidatus Aramenus sp.]|nr:nicotinamide mononucleotide deamidase-related protein [Candidatus Aramenus sp.]